MILHIVRVETAGQQRLKIRFDDGVEKTVDLSPLLDGPIFVPLRDPAYFARVSIDPVAGSAVWPNGADFAPEALHELPAEAGGNGRERAA